MATIITLPHTQWYLGVTYYGHKHRCKHLLVRSACSFPTAMRLHIDGVAARVRKMRVGNGLEPGTSMGPLITASALDKVWTKF